MNFGKLFGKRCEVHQMLNNKNKKWLLHRIKIKGITLRFELGREKAKVMLELGHKSEDKRLEVFEILERYKTIIENMILLENNFLEIKDILKEELEKN